MCGRMSGRMNEGADDPPLKKEFRPLPGGFDAEGKPLTVLGAAFLAFSAVPEITKIVITISPGSEDAARAALPSCGSESLLVSGGPTRRASVHNALAALEAFSPDYVLIHDGARPWVDTALIRRIIEAVQIYGAVIPLLPLTETPKEIDSVSVANTPVDNIHIGSISTDSITVSNTPLLLIRRHLKRANFGAAQTPQAFAYPAILRSHEKAALREQNEGVDYTDDAEVWAEFQGPVAAAAGAPENRKITFPEDMAQQFQIQTQWTLY